MRKQNQVNGFVAWSHKLLKLLHDLIVRPTVNKYLVALRCFNKCRVSLPYIKKHQRTISACQYFLPQGKIQKRKENQNPAPYTQEKIASLLYLSIGSGARFSHLFLRSENSKHIGAALWRSEE